MTVPRSTLRLQFHKGFTFDDALAHVEYFAALGVSHVYASPVTTAEPGSTHGYDTVDYSQISAECGGEAGLRRLVEKLRERGMGLLGMSERVNQLGGTLKVESYSARGTILRVELPLAAASAKAGELSA